VLLVGKVWEAATREARPGSGSYDLVVLDAPPTGRVVPFLRAPETVAELARVGPIRHQADRVGALLDDPERTAVVLTCLPEELPVTETLEGVAALGAAGLPVAAVVANRVTGDRLGGRAGRLAALARDPAPLAAAAAGAGAELDRVALGILVEEARDRQRVVARERRLLKELRAGLDGLPLVELPFLAGGAGGPEEVRVLAGHLAAETRAGLWTAASPRSGRRLPSRSGAPGSRGGGAASPETGPEAGTEAGPEAGTEAGEAGR
jgi:anion-transporting  ArsA/GET3 family ATPase